MSELKPCNLNTMETLLSEFYSREGKGEKPEDIFIFSEKIQAADLFEIEDCLGSDMDLIIKMVTNTINFKRNSKVILRFNSDKGDRFVFGLVIYYNPESTLTEYAFFFGRHDNSTITKLEE